MRKSLYTINSGLYCTIEMILVASENFISFTNNKVENIIFCFKLFDFCVLPGSHGFAMR